MKNRKRLSMQERWHATNQMVDALTRLGWTIHIGDDEQMVLATNGVVHLRARHDAAIMEFGIAEHFDRWANSTDLAIDMKDGDYTSDAIEEILRLVAWVVPAKVSSRDMGDEAVDLRDYMRRFRAETRKADHAAAKAEMEA